MEARRQIYQRYRTAFAGDEWLEMMSEPNWSFSTHWISACTIARESKVEAAVMIRRLSADLIKARPVWKPMQLQPVFARCEYFLHDNSSVSEDLLSRGVCLPSGSNMSTDQIDRIVETVLKIGG